MDHSIRPLTREDIRDAARKAAEVGTGLLANPHAVGAPEHMHWEHAYWAAVVDLEEVCF